MSKLKKEKSWVSSVTDLPKNTKISAVIGLNQPAKTLDEVSPDHKNRYLFAAEACAGGNPYYIFDAGCTVGYGSWILANQGHRVIAIDDDEYSIKRAPKYWPSNNIWYIKDDLENLNDYQKRGMGVIDKYDVCVAFEIIEHLVQPEKFLNWLNPRLNGYLFCSVPNQVHNPFDPVKFPFHWRHYDSEDLTKLLKDCGFRVLHWYCQKSKRPGIIEQGKDGRTIIAIAERIK